MTKSRSVRKKKWSRPKLIVLTRGKPGDGLLVICKHLGGSYHGPIESWIGCYYNFVGTDPPMQGDCVICSAMSTS